MDQQQQTVTEKVLKVCGKAKRLHGVSLLILSQ
jgi:hypothetical protein